MSTKNATNHCVLRCFLTMVVLGLVRTKTRFKIVMNLVQRKLRGNSFSNRIVLTRCMAKSLRPTNDWLFMFFRGSTSLLALQSKQIGTVQHFGAP